MKVWLRAAAVLLGAALALYPLALVGVTYVTGSLAVAAFALLSIASLSGSWAISGAGMAAFVLEYTTALLSAGGEIDLMAPVIGIAVFVFVELVDLVAATKPKASLSASVLWARGAFILRAAVGGGAAATLALAGGLIVRGGQGVLLVVAAACALGTFAIAAGLARGALSADPNDS
ncbi:MAG: hypothetical protein M3214_08535 [Actinomycetota bacterium]|nr:hypothetical protein [Actinomycetota bacterium]